MPSSLGTGMRTALACAALLAAGTAAAGGSRVVETPDGRRSVTVRIDDLDSRSDAGARALYGRLRQASQRVCGTPDRDLRRAVEIRDCREYAVHEAVLALNQPRLNALHAARTGGREPAEVRLSETR